MATRFKKLLWFGASTAIILGMILLADIGEVLSAFAKADISYFLAAFVFGLSTYLVFGFTWYRFFGITGLDISYLKSLRIYFGGQFLNAVTPVGQLGGEPFMAYVIKENLDMKYEEAFCTVLSADIVNAVPIITFVLGGFIYLVVFGAVGDLLLRVLLMVVLVLFLGGAITYLLWFKSRKVEAAIVNFSERISGSLGYGEKYVEALEKRMEGVRETFEVIGAEKTMLASTALIVHSFFVLNVLSLYFVMLSLGIETAVLPLIFVMAFSGVSNFMPTPGGAGAFEATMAGILVFFIGIEPAMAAAAAILFRLTTYWPSTLIGYFSFISLEGIEG